MGWGDWRVIARDPDLVLRGDLPWEQIILDDRHIDLSSLQVTMADTERVRSLLGKGWGMVLLRNDTEVMSGPLVDDGERTWTAATDGKRGMITAQYADDLAIVANELAYPNPAVSATSNTGTIVAHPVTGAAETVIKTVVGANVGTGRTTARGDSGVPHQRLLTIATDNHLGASLTYTPRFDNLLTLIQNISLAGSNIGATVLQSGSSLVFDVYMPNDLTGRMRFSREADNLIAATTSISMPTLTHAVVLGPQQYNSGGTAIPNTQIISEVTADASADAWRMVVAGAVDASNVSGGTSTTAAEMTSAGTAALQAGIRQYARDVTIVETTQVRYRRDIGKGDLVTVVDPTRTGVVITDIVSSFHVELDASQGTTLIQFNVGIQDGTVSPDALVNQLKILKKKASLLTRRTP